MKELDRELGGYARFQITELQMNLQNDVGHWIR